RAQWCPGLPRRLKACRLRAVPTREFVMRSSAYFGLVAAGMAAALISMPPPMAGAAGAKKAATGKATPGAAARRQPTASFAPGNGEARLDEDDEIAALEAIRVALTEVGDGASYVWHRRYG